MYTLRLKHHFDAAHYLDLNYDSPCQNIHGHRWTVIITIISNELDENGILVDFKHLKGVINKLDHKNLNDILLFNPTAEGISHYLYNEVNRLGKFKKVEIEILETPNASITYSKEDDE